jgi:hypothetical protein
VPTASANPLRVLVVQGGIGLCWLLGAPSRTSTPAYKPALALAAHLPLGVYPMRIWGGLLVVIAVGLSYSLRHPNRSTWAWSTALAAYWTFWIVAFGAAIFGNNGGIAPVFFALGFGWYAFERATPHRERTSPSRRR